MPNEIRIPRIVKDLADCPVPLRDYFDQTPEGYRLRLDGDDPDAVKLAEFRDNNRSLNAAKAELEAKLATMTTELESIRGKAATGDEAATKLQALQQQLDQERQTHRQTRLAAVVASAFLAKGGEAKAVDYIAQKAASVFTVDDKTGQLVTTQVGADGARVTLDTWLAQADLAFTYRPSRGGGANPVAHTNTPAAPPKVSRFDTKAVGAHLEAIAAGRMTLTD